MTSSYDQSVSKAFEIFNTLYGEEGGKLWMETVANPNIGAKHNLEKMLARIKSLGRVIPTGYTEFDRILGGGFRNGLNIIMAPPGQGKTTLCLQLAEQFSSNGFQTIYFTNDTAAEVLVSKALSRHTYLIDQRKGISAARILQDISQVERTEIFRQACHNFKERSQHLEFVSGNISRKWDMIKAKVYAHKSIPSSDKPIVVFIDFMQQVKVDYHLGKERLDLLVESMRELCEQLPVAIISVSSINRFFYRQPLQMDAAKESGAIDFGADLMIGVQEVEDKDQDARNRSKVRNMELVFLKQRLGTLGATLPVQFNPEQNRFIFSYLPEKLRTTTKLPSK